ncbi:protease inhibitor I9 family protein, partial [Streptococcus sp. CCUG 49591]
MKKSTVLSLTTAAVILAAYVPNEVVLADTSSSEDALSISDKEKVVVGKQNENKEKHEDIHNVIETSKDTEEKKTTVIEEKEVVSKESVIDNKTNNEKTTIKKEDSNQYKGDNADLSASKDTESPKKEDRLVYIAEFKDKESGEKAIKELSNLKNTKVLYTYDRIFNGSAIETTKDTLDKIKLIEGISSVERSQKVQPMMNHARKEIGVEEAIDYLKSINAPFGKNFDGRGMVI